MSVARRRQDSAAKLGLVRSCLGALIANWLRVLVSVLGGFELLMAFSSAPLLTVTVGVVGGLALVAAPWSRASTPLPVVLLVVGTVPFTVLTWWSVATPVLAVLAASIGVVVWSRDRKTVLSGGGGPRPGSRGASQGRHTAAAVTSPQKVRD